MLMTYVKKPSLKVSIWLLMIIALLLAVHAVGVRRLTPESIRNVIVAAGWWGPAIYIVLYTIRPLLFFPALVLTLAGGLAFGPWWGTVYVVAGGLSGACLCFMLARFMGQEKMKKYLDKFSTIKFFDEKMVDHGFRTIFIMRIVPIFPYDPVSFLAGLSKISFRDYTAATFLGMLPGAFALNVLGYSLTDILSPTFLMAVALTLAAMFLPLVYHLKRSK